MTWDDDLPRGFSDADIEQAEWEDLGRRVSALRRRGVCVHGWTQGPETGPIRCLEDGCGTTFADRDAWSRARADAFAS